MTLQPGEKFIIWRRLPDHSDVNTYYLKAEILEADSGNLLQTIYLDNKGERRFTKDWYVPQDKTGSGYYIIISISVYTDSA